MKPLMKASAIIILTYGMASAYACDSCGCKSKHDHSHEHHSASIVHTAEHAGQFKTLVTALKAADLVEALEAPGPFTVFAPTDAAFAKLPEGTVESLLQPHNRAKLQSILKYHVVSGKVKSSDLLKYQTAKTLLGDKVNLSLVINNARVIQADIGASNGVIHVIDQVILPGSSQPIQGHAKAHAHVSDTERKTIVQTAVNAGQFSTLVTAIKAAGLAEALSGEGPFTVFAPTDEAFAKLPAGTVESLVQPENLAKLQAILKYHVLPAKLSSHDILAAHTVETLNGEVVYPSVLVDDAALEMKNIYCRNGVIHVIDNVILPKDKG